MPNECPAASKNQIKNWARLTHAKFRRKDGLFLAEGVKVIEELLKSDWQIEAMLFLPEKMSHWEKLQIEPAGQMQRYTLTPSEWKQLSQDKEPEGIMAVVRIKEPDTMGSFLQYAKGHLLIGHEISNPQNLGALMRSARWFGFAGILLGTHCVDWTNPKVIRSSMGAVFHLNILADLDLTTILPEINQHFKLIGSDVRQGVAPCPQTGNTALLLGSESHGLPENLLEQVAERWHIPGDSRSESLSLPQAAAIMMYELTKTRTKEQG